MLNLAHIGDLNLHTYDDKVLILKDMLHVPDIKKNLLSVSQLTTCNDIFFEFDSFGCVVMEELNPYKTLGNYSIHRRNDYS